MINIKELLSPKIDYVFKRIFGHIGNEEITKNLLSSIIPDQISLITLNCNPITEKDLLDDKVGILDIKAKLNTNVNCNIEMQIVDKNNIEKRILFYWTKMYGSSINSGHNYENLERSIVILFTDYNLDLLKEIPEYITRWNIREKKYSHLILTDVLEIFIIELKKAKEFSKSDNDNGNKNNQLDSWLRFINNPKAVLNVKNKAIKKAQKVLEQISQDEHERYLAELREKYIMDQQAIESRAYDKGFASGTKQGIEQGIQKKQLEVAKKMKEMKIDVSVISEISGLTEEEISKI